jgi:hypothetical protein
VQVQLWQAVPQQAAGRRRARAWGQASGQRAAEGAQLQPLAVRVRVQAWASLQVQQQARPQWVVPLPQVPLPQVPLPQVQQLPQGAVQLQVRRQPHQQELELQQRRRG